MKKIAICTNLFGKYERQDLCLSNLHYLHTLFPNVIPVLIQFEKESVENPHNFVCQKTLKRSSRDWYPDQPKILPFVNDLFEESSKIDADYFMYINSDILVAKKMINYIMENLPEAIAFSRMDTVILGANRDVSAGLPMRIARIEPAGFDAFLFENNWYQKNKTLFKDMFLGRPVFDNCYASVMAIHSKNVWNNRDEYLYHPKHPLVSFTEDPMYKHNYEIADGFYKPYMDFWRQAEHYTFRARKDWGAFLKVDNMEIYNIIKHKNKFKI